jgi:ATP-dependent DNA helicase RecG
VPSCLPIKRPRPPPPARGGGPRIELKGTWDKDGVGPRLLETICAFANDLHNLNGGYVLIGVDESGGAPLFPPQGLAPEQIEAAQKWIRTNCR